MAVKTVYRQKVLGTNTELLVMMGQIKIRYDLKIVPSKVELDPTSKWEAFAVSDLDEVPDSHHDMNLPGTDMRLLDGPVPVSKHYGILTIKSELDRCHYTVYRFSKKEKRDQVRKAFVVLDKNLQPVPNIDDYIATGTDEQGYFFVIQRDKDVVETAVYTYTDDGQILKNNVNPKSYSNIFDQ